MVKTPSSNIMRASLALLALLTGCGGGGSTAPSVATASNLQAAGGAKLLQFTTEQSADANFENNSVATFAAPTLAGDTLWVAVTVSDYDGPHSIAVSDSQGNEFIALEQENDGTPGFQSVAQFYAPNIHGDVSTPDSITVTWGTDNYKGVLIAELSGVTQAPLVAHAGRIQDGITQGTANVTSGSLAVAADQTPALLLGLSMNTSGGASDLGGSGKPGPAAASGATQVAQFWNWGANLATLSTTTVTGAGNVSAAFDAPDTDSYVTVAAVFH
jgi:hypothetical protein